MCSLCDRIDVEMSTLSHHFDDLSDNALSVMYIVTSTKRLIHMPKRKRKVSHQVSHPQKCPWCDQNMKLMACHIDWEQVWFEKNVNEAKVRKGRELTTKEIQEIKESTGSDPCDDCCCGACGSRKLYPGQVCC